jgi:hypothetical protein
VLRPKHGSWQGMNLGSLNYSRTHGAHWRIDMTRITLKDRRKFLKLSTDAESRGRRSPLLQKVQQENSVESLDLYWMVRHRTDENVEVHGFEVNRFLYSSVGVPNWNFHHLEPTTSLIVSYKTSKPSISEMPRSPVRITYRTHFPQYMQQLWNFTLSIIVDSIFDCLEDNFILALRVVVQFSTSCPTLELWGSPSWDIRQKTAREIF